MCVCVCVFLRSFPGSLSPPFTFSHIILTSPAVFDDAEGAGEMPACHVHPGSVPLNALAPSPSIREAGVQVFASCRGECPALGDRLSSFLNCRSFVLAPRLRTSFALLPQVSPLLLSPFCIRLLGVSLRFCLYS